MSCRECVFRSQYQDMGASADVCTLHISLARAINACEHSEDCKYRFTRNDAMKIAFERAGGKPTDEPDATAAARRESSGDPARDFQEAMKEAAETLRQGLQKLVDNMKPMVESIKAFADQKGERNE